MSTQVLRPAFVGSFPSALEPETLYISVEFNSCAHLCACGCGQEVITPLSPAQWSFSYNGQNVSVRPSIGNWSLECRSHYIIDHGRIVCSRTFSDEEITSNRARDRRAVRRFDRESNKVKRGAAPGSATDDANAAPPAEPPRPPRRVAAPPEPRSGVWRRLWRRVRAAKP